MAAGPGDRQRFDLLPVAQAKVQDRFRAGHESAGRGEVAGQLLIRVGELNRHGGTDAEPVACRPHELNHRPMAGHAGVLEDRRRASEIVHHHVQVPVPVQVRQDGAETDTVTVQPPVGPALPHFQAGLVLKSPVGLEERFLRIPKVVVTIPTILRRRGCAEVAVQPVAAHSVGDEQVLPAVVVQVPKVDRPRPVGFRDAVKLGDLHEMIRPRVQVEGVAHVLRRIGVVQKPGVAVGAGHVPHLHLLVVMRAAGHVGCEKIHPAVVVHVGKVRSHREPRRMGKRTEGLVGECHDAGGVRAVARPKLVRPEKIIGHIQIGPPIPIPVPPDRRKPVMVATQAGLARHLLERFARPVVAVKMIVLAGVDFLVPLFAGKGDEIRVLTERLGQNRLTLRAAAQGKRLVEQ